MAAPSLHELAAQQIAQHLRAWDVEVVAQENVFAVATIPFPCTCEATSHGAVHGEHQVQLDVLVWIDSDAGVVLAESHAGVGRNDTEAVSDAVHKWLEGVYPVLSSAFGVLEARGSAPVVESGPFAFAKDEEGGSTIWKLFAGPVIVVTEPDSVAAFEGVLPLESIRNELGSLTVNGNVMWGRTFVGGVGDELSHECLMMNETWPEGEAALRAVSWPRTQGYASVRQFFVATRD